jgi:ABC-type antimicrobial peptide transport system permease subunit
MHDRVLPRVYLSYEQFAGPAVTLYLRTRGDPLASVGGIKAALRQVDPSLFLEDVMKLTDDNAGFLRPTRLYAVLLTAFGSLAVLLAAIGVFASVSYSVGQRTREMAIRLALGADPRRLVRLVLGEGVRLGISGSIIGLAAALGAARILASLLYGVTTADPLTLTGATAFLLMLVVLACWIPARRTSSTDPAVTLRSE